MRLALLLAFAASACAQPADVPKPDAVPDARRHRADSVIERRGAAPSDSLVEGIRTTERAVRLGDGSVTVRVSAAPTEDGPEGAISLDALNLHDDESTSVGAALDVVGQRGGRVVELVHSGSRNLTFAVGGVAYTADPNRMFTAAGRRRTLGALSQTTPQAEAALEAFADSVLAVYAAEHVGVVVTLHNNTPGGYSAESYAPGGEYAGDAAAVTVHSGTDPDDFFFVTDPTLFDALEGLGFNVVLQDNAAATDDGSLSVWAAQQGVPYVNVEAEHGHRAEQARMIAALVEVLAAGQ